MNDPHSELTRRVAGLLAELPQVEAIALGGSLGSQTGDRASDIDLYVYTRTEIPLDRRYEIMVRSGGASHADMGLNYWGPGDEWYDATSGIEIDLVYFDADWMEGQLRGVIERHQPSLGYSTCFWRTVRFSQVLFDRHGWYSGLQALADQPYPETLRKNIIAYNVPVLRKIIPSMANQIHKAAERNDLVSLNHRLAALLASYFDILFALNRALHPGEKRLATWIDQLCPVRPLEMQDDIKAVLRAAGENTPDLEKHLAKLLDGLEELLEDQGFDPGTGQPR